MSCKALITFPLEIPKLNYPYELLPNTFKLTLSEMFNKNEKCIEDKRIQNMLFHSKAYQPGVITPIWDTLAFQVMHNSI